MAPKKDQGKPKDKVAVDKACLQLSRSRNCTDYFLDIWHEKCSSFPSTRALDPSYSHAPQKKGSVAQKQMKQIAAAAASSKSADDKKKEAQKQQREREKAAAEQARKEAAELFKPVQTQKVPFGVDPKTVLCQFFKAGNCEKGALFVSRTLLV